MSNKNIRIPVIIAVVAVVLGLLFIGQLVYQKYNVEQPLFKVYSKTKAVKKVDVQDSNGQVKVVLELGPTENLQKTYGEIMDTTEDTLGEKPFQVDIKDKRNKTLENLLVETEPVIYEAISKGSYTWMKDEIINFASAHGIKARVFMDGKRIYLSFVSGDKYLYEIIEINRNGLTGEGSKGSENSA